MLNNIKFEDKVHVSGEVFYGGRWYRVDCDGIVQTVFTKSMHIVLDTIDGDGNVCVSVHNNYISKKII